MKPIPNQVAEFKSLINGYKISQILFSVEKLGIFEIMSDGISNIEQIAEKINIPENKLSPLLNGLVHYKLLKKENKEYYFIEDAIIINPSHPRSQNKYIKFSENVRDKWIELSSIVKEKENSNLANITGKSEEQTKNFISAMNVNALPQAKFIADNYNFSKHKILDLGTGSGAYSIAIAKKFSDTVGILFDLPGVINITKEYISNENLNDRFSLMSGDYNESLPDGLFDDILLFAVIHQESDENLYNLLKSIKDSLKSGGKLYLTSFFLNDERTEPIFPVLFSVEMVVMHEKGKVYTFSEIENALKKIGFKYKREDSIPGPATLYVATK